ncbi:Tyrosine aminotransferase [Acorus calamus]|uniref:Tyrosine aminotransferase n=1 Tax=Acorus calamus TaxID=4465 RepID=A0AAV9D4P5_ACOCL|nr:Tyrosine aminotransferase [Acorus calamus]
MAPTTQTSIDENGLQNGCPAKSGNHKSINNVGHYEVPCNPLLMQQKGSLRSVVSDLTSRPNPDKSVIGLALGDASVFPCFRSSRDTLTKPVFDVVDSALFDGYPPSFGYPFARRAVAEYLGCGIKEGEVYLTSGATQAIQVILSALAGPGRNVLLPRPGFPVYASTCCLAGIEPRFYDLLPSNNWELNPSQIMSLANSNTIAIMVTNPNNPCGVVFPRSHLLQIMEVAGKLHLPVIADEIYGHMTFGEAKFVPMASLASATGLTPPVITIGGLSKRWMVPGWRMGWLAFSDPRENIQQAALPDILSNANQEFHNNVLRLLESAADTCYARIECLDALKCHSKPNGSMFMMVEVQTTILAGINDDMDFARELMEEESVLVLPGSVIGLKNWVRIFFGAPVNMLNEAFDRISSFCERHRVSQMLV